MTDPVTVETRVPVPPREAWRAYTDPAAIVRWNFATPEWCCPRAAVDLREGGRYTARMEARDGSSGFDLGATCRTVEAPRLLVLELDDGRLSRTTFTAEEDGTRVRTTFDPETIHPVAMQREGWQAILDQYAAHVKGARS